MEPHHVVKCEHASLDVPAFVQQVGPFRRPPRASVRHLKGDVLHLRAGGPVYPWDLVHPVTVDSR